MTIQWLEPLGKTRSLTEALHSVMVTARAHPGCLGCSVSTNVGERGTVRYSEEWGSTFISDSVDHRLWIALNSIAGGETVGNY